MLVGEPTEAAFGLELLEGAEGEGDIEVFADVAVVDVEVGDADAVLWEVAWDESVGGVAPGRVSALAVEVERWLLALDVDAGGGEEGDGGVLDRCGEGSPGGRVVLVGEGFVALSEGAREVAEAVDGHGGWGSSVVWRECTSVVVRWLAYKSRQYEIPLDRTHIVGHEELATDKRDPGIALGTFPVDELIVEAYVERERMEVAEAGVQVPLSPVLGRWQLVRLLVEDRVRIERELPDGAGSPRYEVTVQQAS